MNDTWTAVLRRFHPLAAAEIERLTIWKWVYQAEVAGFAPLEARHLAWGKWLVQSGRVGEGVA